MKKNAIKVQKTTRGFALVKFTDLYEQKCSLQKSSIASVHAIWFGVDNTGPQLHDEKGVYNADVFSRMHLSQQAVKDLLPILQHFAKTGDLK